LAHWTGHPTRLNREKGKKFGDEQYAFEELIAELTSAFLCAGLGFTKSITNNAAYIKSWISALKNDNKAIFKAAKLAEQASEYIYSFSKVESV
jgi:antirestriction protein ArdC